MHLAALLEGKGKIIACELDKERVKRLKHNVQLAGATSIRLFGPCLLPICINHIFVPCEILLDGVHCCAYFPFYVACKIISLLDKLCSFITWSMLKLDLV